MFAFQVRIMQYRNIITFDKQVGAFDETKGIAN